MLIVASFYIARACRYGAGKFNLQPSRSNGGPVTRIGAGVAGVVLGLAACGGDSSGPGAGVLPDAMVGEWFTGPSCYPQCGLTLVPVGAPQDSLNVTISSTTDLRLTGGGTFRLNISALRDTTIAGQARVEGNALILSGSGATADTIDYQLVGNWLQLWFRRTLPGDLNGDGTEEQIRLQGRWQRR